jgi:diguanylate cyclase (GGDEF)-like protein
MAWVLTPSAPAAPRDSSTPPPDSPPPPPEAPTPPPESPTPPPAPPAPAHADAPPGWEDGAWTQPGIEVEPEPAAVPAPAPVLPASGEPPPDPLAQTVTPRGPATEADAEGLPAHVATVGVPADRPAGPEPGSPAPSHTGLQDPAGWEDELTGLDGPALWARLLVPEIARSARYSRPLTVVLVEVVGLEELASVWGADVALQALPAAARSLRHGARTSDIVCRIGRTRFGILLTETDEIAAINFVERVRAAGPLPEPGQRTTLAYAFGWASVATGDDPPALIRRAECRLDGELRP